MNLVVQQPYESILFWNNLPKVFLLACMCDASNVTLKAQIIRLRKKPIYFTCVLYDKYHMKDLLIHVKISKNCFICLYVNFYVFIPIYILFYYLC